MDLKFNFMNKKEILTHSHKVCSTIVILITNCSEVNKEHFKGWELIESTASYGRIYIYIRLYRG